MTQKVDTLDAEHKSLSDEIRGDSGLKRHLSELQEQSGSQEDRMRHLEEENAKLKRELTVLKNIVIHTNHRVTHNETQITDLKIRSMSANILIHGIKEKQGENLNDDISQLFNDELGLTDIKFSSIHRMGSKPSAEIKPHQGVKQKNPKPRIIVARLANPEKKSDIITKALNSDVNFRVTNQHPEELRDARSRLYHVKSEYDEKEIDCEIKGSKLVLKDSGAIYREKVTLPSPEVLLTATDPQVKSQLDKIDVYQGDTFRDKGNHIVSFSSKVNSFKEVKNFSLKVLASEQAIPANSNVLVYSFLDTNGSVHEGWVNDREFGAGLDILKSAKEQEYQNYAVILSRKLGDHLGFKRHQVFQDNALSAIIQTQ